MRLQLESTSAELTEKGPALIKVLAQHLAPYAPALAQSLEKALKKEPALKYKVLRQLHAFTKEAYQKQSLELIDDVEAVLLGAQPKALKKAEEDDPDYDAETGDPIFDPKTGLSPTETTEAKEHGESDEEEDTEKSVGSMHDHGNVDVDGDDDEQGPPEKGEEDEENLDNDIDGTGNMPVDSKAIGKSLEGYPMADALAKAGSHKYTKRWKDKQGNWQYEYPTTTSGGGQTAKEDSGERWGADKTFEALMSWGDRLYSLQAGAGNVRDDTGFNSNDVQVWRRGVTTADHAKRILKKYKRQIAGFVGASDYYRAGLGDAVAAATVAMSADQWGGVALPVDGRIGKKVWNAYLASMRSLKEGGWCRFAKGAWYIPADKVTDFPVQQFNNDMEALGLQVKTLATWPPAETVAALSREKRTTAAKASGGLPQEATAAELVRGIQQRRVQSTIVVQHHKTKSPGGGFDVGAFTFHSAYSPTFNDLFSNKKANLSGLTEYSKELGHARVTYSLELVEEAIDKLKAALPDWKIVTEGIREAQEERERYQAEIKKPIPEIQKVMGIDPATGKPYQLFPYQNEGVRFIQSHDGRAILGDEMGLGKTLQALGYVVAGGKRALAVVPKVVRRQWLDEADRFFPGAFHSAELVKKDLTKLLKKSAKVKNEYIAHLTRQGDEGDADAVRMADHFRENLDSLPVEDAIAWKLGLQSKNLVTINYEAVEAYLPYLKAAGLDTVIIDESDRIKNGKAKITQRLSKLGASFKHRILMSGTVVRNKREELFTQAELVQPGLFEAGELKGMGSTIGGSWHKARKIMISRQKKNVLPDLPPKTTTVSRQEMSGIPDIEGKLEIGDISALKSAVARAKAPYTADLVKQMLAQGEGKIIVFTDLTEAAKDVVAKLGDVAVLHHGGLSDKRRAEAVSTFQNAAGGPRVFVSTTGSAGVGLNLQVANQVVFNDLPWTGAGLRQAEDRAHRASSTQPVNVLHVTAKDNLWDETVNEIIQRKLILHAKMQHGQQLTEEERAWEKTPLTFAEVLKQLQGEKAKPAVQVSGSDESLDESKGGEHAAPKPVKLPVAEAGVVRSPVREPVRASVKQESVKRDPVKRQPVKGSSGQHTLRGFEEPGQLALFKARFASPFEDHTEVVAEKDASFYDKARAAVEKLDSTILASDFDSKDGRYYGWSTNQLVEYVRAKKG